MKIILFLLLSASCQYGDIKLKAAMTDSITRIEVIDRTCQRVFSDKVVSEDSSIIRSVVNEISNLREVGSGSPNVQPSMKSNFGFYDINLFSKSVKVENLQIVYTVYDGVIIVRNNNRYFKNDNFEISVVRLLEASK